MFPLLILILVLILIPKSHQKPCPTQDRGQSTHEQIVWRPLRSAPRPAPTAHGDPWSQLWALSSEFWAWVGHLYSPTEVVRQVLCHHSQVRAPLCIMKDKQPKANVLGTTHHSPWLFHSLIQNSPGIWQEEEKEGVGWAALGIGPGSTFSGVRALPATGPALT